jgi:DNA-binding GntR family transcriptional regulator
VTVAERKPKELAYEFVCRRIREDIISLKLEPGRQFSENELCEIYGMSRTPIRDALRELSRTRIVEVYPQTKSVIAYIDYDPVDEAQFIRSCLERGVINICCDTVTAADIQRLDENVKLQEFYLERQNRLKLQELDNVFHSILFDIAKKPQANAFIQSASIHFDRVRNISLSVVADLKIVEDHRVIVEALAARDHQKSLEVLEKHLNRYKIDRDAIYKKYPQYFKDTTHPL